jgi:two-component system nitrate/nitrite response regulator NarL
MTTGILRIAVVDDHEIIRLAIRNLLAAQGGFEFVGEGGTAEDAVDLATRLRPDVITLDLSMPGGGLEALRTIRMVAPDVRCVIFTSRDDAAMAIVALREGAAAYIPKTSSPASLIQAIEAARNGSTFVTPEFAKKIIQATLKAQDAVNERLNHREEQVMKGVGQGLTNRQIADKLGLSEKTVKHYMSGVLQKLGAPNRTAALAQMKTSMRHFR